jgi:ornithine decarboxylase
MTDKLLDGLPLDFVRDLKYQTPFFLFSTRKVLREYRRFQKCFPGATVYYAMKANSERKILEALADGKAGFEAASACELKLLQTLKVSPKRIIYGSCVKPAEQIAEFHSYGVDKYAADSFAELNKISSAAPGSKVFIRVRVEDKGSAFRFSEKFGTRIENVVPMLLEARRLGLEAHGVSFHVGSQAADPMAWAAALKIISPALSDLRRSGIEANTVNLGGGFPCAYASNGTGLTLETISENTLPQIGRLPYQPRLVLEPGRRIVATSAILVTSVIGRVKRGKRTWLFLDAGVYNALFEALACQASMRYRVTSLAVNPAVQEMSFALAGPTGDGLDIITRNTKLPTNTDVGDKLIIHDTGAYSLALSSEFNGFRKPSVHFV